MVVYRANCRVAVARYLFNVENDTAHETKISMCETVTIDSSVRFINE